MTLPKNELTMDSLKHAILSARTIILTRTLLTMCSIQIALFEGKIHYVVKLRFIFSFRILLKEFLLKSQIY